MVTWAPYAFESAPDRTPPFAAGSAGQVGITDFARWPRMLHPNEPGGPMWPQDDFEIGIINHQTWGVVPSTVPSCGVFFFFNAK